MFYATKLRHYIYETFSSSGKRIRHHIQARSRKHAKLLLSQKAINPIQINRSYRLFGNKYALSKKHLLHLTFHLHQAIQAHLALPQILLLLWKKENKPQCKALLYHLLTTVEQGQPLSVAMTSYHEPLPEDFIACIRAGETHGDLARALAQAHENLEAHCKLIHNIKKALTYPIIIIVLASAIMVAMGMFVIPQFSEMYQQLGSALPGPTRILIQLSRQGIHAMPIIIIGLCCLISAFKIALSRLPTFAYQWQKICLYLPIVGSIIRERNIIQWLRICGTLTQAGIHLTQAMQQAQTAIPYHYFKTQLQLCAAHIAQGMLLSKSLSAIDFLTEDIQLTIHMGEQNGQLAATLSQQAKQRQHALTEKLTQLTRLLEPLIMVILAGVLGSILIVLYLPLFNLGRLF